jgi:hypothetical protein
MFTMTDGNRGATLVAPEESTVLHDLAANTPPARVER